MSSPVYSSANTPLKNLAGLLRFFGVTPIPNSPETAIAKVLHKLTGYIGVPDQTPATITTAGAGTYSAANIGTGLIKRDPNGADRTDTTATAAALISALNLDADYKFAFCTVVNTADAAETITLAGGTGVTLKGAITCEQNCVIRLAFVRTSGTTIAVRQV